MNKSYLVDPENNVYILTDKGDYLKQEGKYTKNTDEILSLENASNSLLRKINSFKLKIEELTENNKNNKNDLIILIIIFLCCSVLSLITPPMLFLIKIISIITAIIIPIGVIIKTLKIKTNNKEIKNYEKRIIDNSHIIKKINKRIASLSKDKNQIKSDKINELTEIKPIYNFNFDPSDYFVEKYQIDKRANEMKHIPKKVRKIKKESNSFNI